jgi:hypothetical protein
MTLELDELFLIAEAGPVLDGMETVLRDAGLNREADALMKLQQDTGVQIDREMNGFDPNEAAPGPASAALSAAFEPVTRQRLAEVLTDVYRTTAKGQMDQRFTELMRAFHLSGNPSESRSTAPPKPQI